MKNYNAIEGMITESQSILQNRLYVAFDKGYEQDSRLDMKNVLLMQKTHGNRQRMKRISVAWMMPGSVQGRYLMP